MSNLLDNCQFNPTTGGTTDWTFSSAVTGYQSPSAAGGVNSAIYTFFAISADSTQWELAKGAYNSSTGVFARTTILYSSAANAKVSFTLAPTVSIVAGLEDLASSQDNGFAMGMAGGTLVASVASSILTVAVKTFAGNDPSASDPVFFYFRDATLATGDYLVRMVTSALSVTTVAVGATLGSANAVPFRLWVNAFDNAGTVVLGLWQSVTGGATPTAIAPLDETTPVSTTVMSGTSTAAGTHYTTSALTTKAFRILGYLDYGSGLATAGTYASTPTNIQLFGPGVKKPGEVAQKVRAAPSTQESTTSTTYVASTNYRIAITPTSAPNLVEARFYGNARQDTAGVASYYRWSRGVTSNSGLFGNETGFLSNAATGIFIAGIVAAGLDAPGTTSSTTYTMQFKNSGAGTAYINGFTSNVPEMTLEEIMV